MTTYATRSDLDDFGGLPDGALSNGGRLVASVSVTGNTLELDAHGFVTNETLTVRPADDGVLPAPLVEGTTYYAIRVSDERFSLSLTEDGAAIDLTTAGTGGTFVVKPLPIDRYLALYSRWVDDHLPAHLVPLVADDDGAFPLVIVHIVAQLAGKALLNRDGKSSEIVDKAEIVAMAQLARWAKGIPVRDAGMTASANLAITATLASVADPRGWGSGSLP